MANPDKFKNLYDIYNLVNPRRLKGRLKLRSGITENAGAIDKLQEIFVNTNAGGTYKFQKIKETLDEYCKGKNVNEDAKKSISEIVSIIDIEGSKIDFLKYWQAQRPVKGGKMEYVPTSNIRTILPGVDQSIPTSTNVGVALIRTPFVHPATRSTNECDLFLNYMPPLVVSRLTPYMSVEIQKSRDDDSERPYGLMRFLMGGSDPSELSTQDRALVSANSYTTWKTTEANGTKSAQVDKKYAYAGMEMFTSPQTLVNMNELSAGAHRYVDVRDPFRPFMSLDSVSISDVSSGAAAFTNRRGKITFTLHDKSRVSEIAELITPKRYKGVSMWLTYGWLAPRDEDNEYFEFINNNMLRRELYQVVNTSFSLNNSGQMTINVELFTLGSSQILSTTILDDELTSSKELAILVDEIRRNRKNVSGLDKKPEGISSDIRIYQVLDAASAGGLPDMDPVEADKAVNSYTKRAREKAGGSSKQEEELIEKLVNFTRKSKNPKKYEFQQKIKDEATQKVNAKFKEMLDGLDPFLPQEKEGSEKGKIYDELLVKMVDEYNKDPTVVSKNKDFSKKVVSFGKLFMSFIVKPILANEDVDELQVIFYCMNEQCGPVSMHSVAEFPIDVPQLQDQYRDHVMKRGGEKFTLHEFLQLVINSQFLDRRAIGYGLRTYYEPYDSDNQEAKERQGNKLEDGLNAMITKYGGFKLPNIVLHIETINANGAVDGQGPSRDALIDRLEVSEKKMILDKKVNSGKNTRILRLHVYDRQTTPYRAVESIVRIPKDNGTHSFAYVSTEEIKSELVRRRAESKMTLTKMLEDIKKTKGEDPNAVAKREGAALAGEMVAGGPNLPTVNYAGEVGPYFVRDQLANTVPSIVIGTNGSLVTNAALSSKMDPLNSTVNMQKNERIQNKVSPNGAGDYGLPMRVVPASMSLTSMGCPLATFAQQFYVDFGTGTTLDNLYGVNGVAHNFAPGKYETAWTFVYSDAYGRYIGAQSIEDRVIDASISSQKETLDKENKDKAPKKSAPKKP